MSFAMLVFALTPLSATVATIGTLPKDCGPTARTVADRKVVRVTPLATMPPAKHIRGVYRSVNGCATPVVLRERVGTTPPPPG